MLQVLRVRSGCSFKAGFILLKHVSEQPGPHEYPQDCYPQNILNFKCPGLFTWNAFLLPWVDHTQGKLGNDKNLCRQQPKREENLKEGSC